MRVAALLLLACSAHAHTVECSSADTTPSLNAAIAAAVASPTDKTINLPAGDCRFATQPAPLSGGVALVGQGKATTVLRRAYSGDFLKITGNGVRVSSLSVYADAGTSGGVGIQMVADNTQAGGNHLIENVWVTGLGTWAVPLGTWGADRSLAPAGIRTVTLRDVSLFNATSWGAVLWGCVSCEWFGGGVYQGYGTTQAIVVGGTNASRNRIDANIDWNASTVYSGVLRSASPLN